MSYLRLSEPHRFVLGPRSLVTEIAERSGAPPILRRDFAVLQRKSDSQAHFSLLVAPNFMLTDGRSWFRISMRNFPGLSITSWGTVCKPC